MGKLQDAARGLLKALAPDPKVVLRQAEVEHSEGRAIFVAWITIPSFTRSDSIPSAAAQIEGIENAGWHLEQLSQVATQREPGDLHSHAALCVFRRI